MGVTTREGSVGYTGPSHVMSHRVDSFGASSFKASLSEQRKKFRVSYEK